MKNKGREIILRLVADGKISVEEAEELLDAVGSANDDQEAFFASKDDAKQEKRDKEWAKRNEERAKRDADRMKRNAERAKRNAEQARKRIRQERIRARAETARARADSPGKNFRFDREFNFDFDFPWDQPGWQWPWEQEGWKWPWEKSGEAEPVTELEVPEETQLKISLAGGDLSIRGSDEPSRLVVSDPRAASAVFMEDKAVQMALQGGDLAIEVPANVVSVEISLKGGDLSIDNLTTDLSASIAGGDANLSKIKSSELAMQTDSGDIALYIPAKVEEGSISLSSDSGDISLALSSDSECQIIADAPGGDISHVLSSESKEIIEEDDHHLNAKLNGGGADVILSTKAGDINVKA